MLLCCQEHSTSCMRPNSWKMEPMVPLLMTTKTCHPGCETADVKEPLYCLFWQNASEDRGLTPPRYSHRGAHTESSFRTHNSMLWTGQLCHSLHSCCDQVRQLQNPIAVSHIHRIQHQNVALFHPCRDLAKNERVGHG